MWACTGRRARWCASTSASSAGVVHTKFSLFSYNIFSVFPRNCSRKHAKLCHVFGEKQGKLAFWLISPKKDRLAIETSYHFLGNVNMTLKFVWKFSQKYPSGKFRKIASNFAHFCVSLKRNKSMFASYAGGWWGTTTRRSTSTSSSTPFIFTSTPSSSTRRSERQASLPCSIILSLGSWLHFAASYVFGRCLDSNPESCRSKQARFQLIHPSPYRYNLATHLPTLSHPSPYNLATHLPALLMVANFVSEHTELSHKMKGRINSWCLLYFTFVPGYRIKLPG